MDDTMFASEAPRISRASAAFVGAALAAMALVTAVAFGLQVLLPYAKAGTPPNDWSGTTIAIAISVLVGLYTYLGATVYQRFATVVSATGVSVPTLRGRRNIPWSEVQRVGIRGHEVLLDAPGGRIVINSLCFADPKAVTAYLQARLSRPSPGDSGAV